MLKNSTFARTRALIVGSVAFDLIFGIHGKIQDEILVEKDGKLGRQNLMFTAKSREHFFGGTGGNIAYGLGLLKQKPLLFSLAGQDFDLPARNRTQAGGSGFLSHLEKAGVDSRVVVDEKGWTATFYGMSDELGQQIGVYQPNAYEKVHTVPLSKTVLATDFKNIGVAIFSAGTGMSILRHMKETREKCGKDTLIIFDPGQVISIFYDKTLLEQTLALADIFIGNEVEIKQLQTILGYSIEKVLEKGMRAVIETLGEKGSVIYEDGKTTRVNAVKAKKVVEATGAGDAYRAGMIAQLLQGKNLKDACTFGAKIASLSVGSRGGQNYRI
ncbi:MAG: PfkB family carbohydrate kinase [bacterium]|nr:PfkB family carbohydrate kinase [bacterium]